MIDLLILPPSGRDESRVGGEPSLYLQQRIISLLDGFVRSDAVLKMTTSNSGLMGILRDEFNYERPGTCPPPFVKSFMTADELGSKGLRGELEERKGR